jgi:hypothetical protein
MQVQEMEAKLGSVASRANAALALAIILLTTHVVTTIIFFKAWRKTRESQSPSDFERGMRRFELQNNLRGIPTGGTRTRQPRNTSRAAPAAAPAPTPIASSVHSLGLPAAAYTTDHYGENRDYYFEQPSSSSRPPTTHTTTTNSSRFEKKYDESFQPTPISKRPTYTKGSGIGEQIYGVDYTKELRTPRHGSAGGPGPTNVNDADYGRKGNKFAHGH